VLVDGLTQGNIACPLPTGALAIQLNSSGGSLGLQVNSGASGSTIRGLSITNFTGFGIVVAGADVTIACNYLGIEADGNDGGTNGNGVGINVLAGATNVAIGGPGPGEGNVIAFNTDGVVLSSNGARVQGNTIRGNLFHSVVIDSGTGNRVTRNSIFGNGTLGIDLTPAGVTPNDPGDADGGSNNLQNFPVLTGASTSGANTTVVGTLDSAPGAYTVELFSNAACDAPGHGEGETFLGPTTVTISGPGTTASFSATLPAVALGQVITATASRNVAPRDTSEFSACRAVTGPPGVTVTETGGTAVAEGGATDTFQVRLNAPPTANVTVQLASAPVGQLQPIADLVFTPANWDVDQTVTVAAVDDAASEGPHAATIGLTATSTDSGYAGLVIPSVSVAITDNDTPGFTITPTGGLTTTEAGGTATFTVRLNTVPTQPVTIGLTSSDTSEGTVGPGSLTFTPANALTPQTVTITGVQDAIADGAVAYTIVTGLATSADPNHAGLDPVDVAVTNADDDGPPGLAINDATAAEGDAGAPTLTFTVTLTLPSAQVVTVQFATANGTATGGPACAAGVDYLATSATLTFQPTETTKPIAVTLCPDAEVEGDETLLVNLSTLVNSAIGDGQGQGTIRNDDAGGSLSFSASTVSVPESAGSVAITVQRTGVGAAGASQATGSTPATSVASGSVRPGPSPTTPSTGTVSPSAIGAVTVSFATADQTAKAGQDYVATAGTVTLGVGETAKTITIPTLADNLVEGPESFTVTLSGPTGGANLGQQATITVVIVDTTHASAPPSPGDDSADDERVERERETEEERRQRARTNQGNKDDDSTEGDVIETAATSPGRPSSSPTATARSRSG